MALKEYVRLSFLPAGAKRRRSVWALVMSRKPNLVTYREVSREGDEDFEVAGGIVQQRIIIARPFEVVEKPAKINLTYAELEVVK